jgi:hypothetical protein
MKKTYIIPSVEVIRIQTQQIICMSILENSVTNPLAPALDDDELEGFFHDEDLSGFFAE